MENFDNFKDIAPFLGISQKRVDEIVAIIENYTPHEYVVFWQYDKRDTYLTDAGLLPHEIYFAGMIDGAKQLIAWGKMEKVKSDLRKQGVLI